MNLLEQRLNTPLLKRIISLLPPDQPIYLVGGVVRDAFLGRPSYDLDFLTGSEAMSIARKLADALGAAYFPLDAERKVARLVLKPDHRYGMTNLHPIKVDFSAYQADDLEADLRGRDFTINAMAVNIRQLDTIIDPLNGASDLVAKRLRACSPGSLEADPIRILRAVRLSVDQGLKILPATLLQMRKATPHLPRISLERIRDELFRILTIKHPASSVRILDNLGALDYLIPEVVQLKGVSQSAPHIWDVYNHTLDLLDRLEDVFQVLSVECDPDKTENLAMGLLVMRIGRYRQQLAEHMDLSINPDRSLKGLLFFAGLYHDVGKAGTHIEDEQGKIRFFGHDQLSGMHMRERGEELRLSNLEIDRLLTIVHHHMRPSALSHSEVMPSRKAIYRFFRDTGSAGVDICLLSLADMLATYGPTLPQERWARHLDVIRLLFQAWWEERDESIAPPALIKGDELMQKLGITTGPIVGYLLEAIREAQVSGDVRDTEAAIALAGQLLQDYNENGLFSRD